MSHRPSDRGPPPQLEHVQAPAHHHHHHHSHHSHSHSIPTPTAIHASSQAPPPPPPPSMHAHHPVQNSRPLPPPQQDPYPPGVLGLNDHHHHHHVPAPPPPHSLHSHPSQHALGPPQPPPPAHHHYANHNQNHQHAQAGHQLAPVPTAPADMPLDLDALLREGQAGRAAYNSSIASFQPSRLPVVKQLDKTGEDAWLIVGSLAEQMADWDVALMAYQRALRHNPHCKHALAQIGAIARGKEDFSTAVDYLSRVLQLDQGDGELWSALGHCYLMLDALPKAYSAYQQALYCLQNPTNVKLWYGIGILYDRYGSLEHAEEAFTSVLRMEDGNPNPTVNVNEVFFRLGIIYKQQHKLDDALNCFERIAVHGGAPTPLKSQDVWFQIGHVYEQKNEFELAKQSYERVLIENPSHAKVLQQLGWLYFQTQTSFHNTESAIECLTRSLGAGSMSGGMHLSDYVGSAGNHPLNPSDESDAQSWYLLGRAYMSAEKYNKAYEAYQQAVYRDGRNPTFWCSIGVLYYQIQQFRDALDAYSRAIRINPYIAEVWFDLGCLYESCNNQISDAIDAYKRALELDQENVGIKDRLRLLEEYKITGGPPPPPPPVLDVHPTAYSSPQAQLGPNNNVPPSRDLGMPTPRIRLEYLPPTNDRHPALVPRNTPPSAAYHAPPPPPQQPQSAHDHFRPPHLASLETSRSGIGLPPLMEGDRVPGGLAQQQHHQQPSLPSISHGGGGAYYGREGELHAMQQAQMQQVQQQMPPPSRGAYDPTRHEQHRPASRITPPQSRHVQHHQHAPGYPSSHHALLNPATPPAHHVQRPEGYGSLHRHPLAIERDRERDAERERERERERYEQDRIWAERGDVRGPDIVRPYDGNRMPMPQPQPPHSHHAPREHTPASHHFELRRPSPPPRIITDTRREAPRSPVAPYQHGENPAWRQQQQQGPLPGPPAPPPIPPPTQSRRYDPLYDLGDDSARREMPRREPGPVPPALPPMTQPAPPPQQAPPPPPPAPQPQHQAPPPPPQHTVHVHAPESEMPPPRVKTEQRAAALSLGEDVSRVATASPAPKDNGNSRKRKSRGKDATESESVGKEKKQRRSRKMKDDSSEKNGSPTPSRLRSRQKGSPESVSNGRRASRASATPSSTAAAPVAPPPAPQIAHRVVNEDYDAPAVPPPAQVAHRIVNEDYDEGPGDVDQGAADTLIKMSTSHFRLPEPTVASSNSNDASRSGSSGVTPSVVEEVRPPSVVDVSIAPSLPPAMPISAPKSVSPPVTNGIQPTRPSPVAAFGPEKPPSLERAPVPYGPSPPPQISPSSEASMSTVPPKLPSPPVVQPTPPAVQPSPPAVVSPSAITPAPVFHGPPRPPEMLGQSVASSPPVAVSPTAALSPTTLNGLGARSDTPGGPVNPRKRVSPPSPSPPAEAKRAKTGPSPPPIVSPQELPPPPVPQPLAQAASRSPPQAPPIATLEDPASPPESAVEGVDQLAETRQSPTSAKSTSKPPVLAVSTSAVPSVATTHEQSPMDTGD